MKLNYWTFIIAASLAFISCGEKDSEKSNSATTEEAMLETEKPQSLIKDSFTYYNAQQKKVDVVTDQYFGFVFKAEGQDLQWQLDPNIGANLAYVSEVYEPELDLEDSKSDGKQYFTFQAAKKGESKLKFISKVTQDTKTINIHIK